MTTARLGGTATLLLDDRVLLAGGRTEPPGGILSTAEVYDPRTSTFSLTGSMTAETFGITATRLLDGRVLIAGFALASRGNPQPAELYHPKTGTFSRTGALARARNIHTATLLPDGRVLIAGGLDPEDPGEVLATAELYDPASGSFGPTGSMATAREAHTATLLLDGRVLVAGGTDDLTGGVDGSKATAELYDPGTGTFAETGSLTTARERHTETLLADGRVLIVGGASGSEILATAELYDPASGSFGPTGSMATAREAHTATLLPDGRVLVAGGANGTGSSLASAELYDPITGTFVPTGPMMTARSSQTATPLSDGRVLVAGGLNDSGFLASAELYDPGTGGFDPAGR